MRQGQQNRRSRGRGRKQQNSLARNYESTGPDVKIRGTASHIAEKYASLARDMLASGDMVTAENYLQHAEHYMRIIMAAQSQSNTVSRDGDGVNGSSANGRSEGVEEAEVSAAPHQEGANDGDAAPAVEQGREKQNRENNTRENQGARRGRRRSNVNGRRAANGDVRKVAEADEPVDEATPGEFAGLPPSISTGKSRAKAENSQDVDGDDREASDNMSEDAADGAIAS